MSKAVRRSLTEKERAVSRRLKEHWEKRTDRGLSQKAAAARLGWAGQSTVSQYLNAVIPPNTDIIIAFCRLLGIQPGDVDPDLSFLFLKGLITPPVQAKPISTSDIDSALESVMEKICLSRVAALKAYIGEDTIASFSDRWGFDPTYISQLLNQHRGFGEKAARRIELAMQLPVGALDAIEGEVTKPMAPEQLTRDERALLETYRTLKKPNRDMARRILACID